ncbi:hypothetical protein M408DRAFT_330772 [Serendipita vermifera MAFF 305830]|uniref:Uncharacterized protein n=1 Tax=Serendipita vermifera MAFF 305830 TaxID=933852 RepID=A0A0C3AN23_SERVB|nr:hypothetical protein M408DRAFT_330772 [Serendipita vermifera MAFF 305830]
MASISSSLQHLFHGLYDIFAGLGQSVFAVITSIFALAQNLVQAVFGIVSTFVTAIVDLMSGALGFVMGNLFIILALGAAYWFYATQTQTGRQKTAGGTKNPLK